MTDDALEPGPVARLDPLELCLVRLDHVQYALAAGEHLRRRRCGKRLHEYGGQVRAVLLGEYTGELQDACGLGPSIDEDDDLPDLRVVAPAQ